RGVHEHGESSRWSCQRTTYRAGGSRGCKPSSFSCRESAWIAGSSPAMTIGVGCSGIQTDDYLFHLLAQIENVGWAERSEAHADFKLAPSAWARRFAPLPTLHFFFHSICSPR